MKYEMNERTKATEEAVNILRKIGTDINARLTARVIIDEKFPLIKEERNIIDNAVSILNREMKEMENKEQIEYMEFEGHIISWDQNVSDRKRVYLVDNNYVCTSIEEAYSCIESINKFR
jgi:hypothetical protein